MSFKKLLLSVFGFGAGYFVAFGSLQTLPLALLLAGLGICIYRFFPERD